ncbi:flavin reductase family protein [Streptantibioticus parmotrematis]|uniref:flavin reductase family protein n=1 Tax=Streptantibioticus parmotrematis TaxID=2873249 RepID=UPI0033E27294
MATTSTTRTADDAAREVVAPRALRTFLGNFATGVTVVTYRRGDFLNGATVNSFTSVSLDPPLVLVALDRRTRSADHLGSGPYTINILADGQRDLATHFAGATTPATVPWIDEDTEAPRLAGGVGHLRCEPWRTYDGGDHLLVVGRVWEFEARRGRPLLFFRGAFPRLAGQPGDTAWAWSLDDPTSGPQFTALD